jgi:hypothetical protein
MQVLWSLQDLRHSLFFKARILPHFHGEHSLFEFAMAVWHFSLKKVLFPKKSKHFWVLLVIKKVTQNFTF